MLKQGRGWGGKPQEKGRVGVGGGEARTQVCDAIAGRRSGLSDGAGKDKYASRMTNGNRGDTAFGYRYVHAVLLSIRV